MVNEQNKTILDTEGVLVMLMEASNLMLKYLESHGDDMGFWKVASIDDRNRMIEIMMAVSEWRIKDTSKNMKTMTDKELVDDLHFIKSTKNDLVKMGSSNPQLTNVYQTLAQFRDLEKHCLEEISRRGILI